MLRSLWQRKKLQRRMINFWRVIWIITLLIGEWYLFIMAMKGCQWKSSYDSSISELQRIAIIADPQVTDFYSYKGRNRFLMWFTEKYSDLYMKRSYKHLTNQLQPDASLFLGDLMDGGREWDDEGFNKQVDRFFNIFPQDRVNKNIYTTGNHDIGIRDGIKNGVYLRFQSIFGSTSSIHPLAYNHTLVVLDTVLLTGNQKNKPLQKESWDIINEMAQQQQRLKKLNQPSSSVLFSHVPFYRPEGTFCGPLRVQSRPSIYQGYGYQYQNLLESRLSNFLLYHLQPKLIFSGDDHDFCNITHEYYDVDKNKKQAIEFTVPSFSMAQGVRSPGFMLLQPMNNNNNNNDNDDEVTQQQQQDPFLSQLCWLPDQLGIFISYGIIATFTLISIFIKHTIWYYYRYKRFSMLENKKLDQKEIDEYFIGMDLDHHDDHNDHKQQEQSSYKTTTSSSILYNIVLPSLYDLKDIIIIALPFYILCLFIL
ncbi:unnamed protein product [Cunninghamella blakesleeana]